MADRIRNNVYFNIISITQISHFWKQVTVDPDHAPVIIRQKLVGINKKPMQKSQKYYNIIFTKKGIGGRKKVPICQLGIK